MFKNVLQGKKAVTFDLDGTLVDTKPLWDRAFSELCNSLNLVCPDLYELLGVRNRDKWERTLALNPDVKVDLSPVELEKKTSQKYLQLLPNAGLEVIDGFWDLSVELKYEKNFKLGLVTNSEKEVATRVLGAVGIHDIVFDVMVTGDEVDKRKPDPQIYDLAAQRLGVSSSEILSFEDSPPGVKAALDSGCDVIVVWNPRVSESKYPKNVVTFIGDYTHLIGKFDMTFEEMLNEAAKGVDEFEERKKVKENKEEEESA